MTEADQQKLFSFDCEVQRLIAWCANENRKMKSLTMFVGGTRELIQEVVVETLKVRDQIEFIRCSWSTYVVNKTRWVLFRLLEKFKNREKRHLKFALDRARSKSWHDDPEPMEDWIESVRAAVTDTLLLKRKNRSTYTIDAVWRFYGNGETSSEIARSLGFTSSAIKESLSQSRKKMRDSQRLKKLWADYQGVHVLTNAVEFG